MPQSSLRVSKKTFRRSHLLPAISNRPLRFQRPLMELAPLRFFLRHLCAFLPSLGKPDRNRLLPARYLATFTALTRTKRTFFFSTDGALDTLARCLSILATGFFRRLRSFIAGH